MARNIFTSLGGLAKRLPKFLRPPDGDEPPKKQTSFLIPRIQEDEEAPASAPPALPQAFDLSDPYGLKKAKVPFELQVPEKYRQALKGSSPLEKTLQEPIRAEVKPQAQAVPSIAGEPRIASFMRSRGSAKDAAFKQALSTYSQIQDALKEGGKLPAGFPGLGATDKMKAKRVSEFEQALRKADPQEYAKMVEQSLLEAQRDLRHSPYKSLVADDKKLLSALEKAVQEYKTLEAMPESGEVQEQLARQDLPRLQQEVLRKQEALKTLESEAALSPTQRHAQEIKAQRKGIAESEQASKVKLGQTLQLLNRQETPEQGKSGLQLQGAKPVSPSAPIDAINQEASEQLGNHFKQAVDAAKEIAQRTKSLEEARQKFVNEFADEEELNKVLETTDAEIAELKKKREVSAMDWLTVALLVLGGTPPWVASEIITGRGMKQRELERLEGRKERALFGKINAKRQARSMLAGQDVRAREEQLRRAIEGSKLGMEEQKLSVGALQKKADNLQRQIRSLQDMRAGMQDKQPSSRELQLQRELDGVNAILDFGGGEEQPTDQRQSRVDLRRRALTPSEQAVNRMFYGNPLGTGGMNA